MKTPQELIKVCMKDFEDTKHFGIKENHWIPFKHAWFKGYELGAKDSEICIVCQEQEIIDNTRIVCKYCDHFIRTNYTKV